MKEYLVETEANGGRYVAYTKIENVENEYKKYCESNLCSSCKYHKCKACRTSYILDNYNVTRK